MEKHWLIRANTYIVILVLCMAIALAMGSNVLINFSHDYHVRSDNAIKERARLFDVLAQHDSSATKRGDALLKTTIRLQEQNTELLLRMDKLQSLVEAPKKPIVKLKLDSTRH